MRGTTPAPSSARYSASGASGAAPEQPPYPRPRFARFQPYLINALRGYSNQRLLKDISAGVTVGIVALPLAMAFAMASGLKPGAGIFTAIIAGFLISSLGGSRVLAKNVPLAALSVILIFVAWNMGQWREFVNLRQYRVPYRVTLLSVFFLTVIFDLTVAVEVGLIAACVTFIYRISSLSRSEQLGAADQPLLAGHEGRIAVYRLYGAIFFGAVKLMQDIEGRLPMHTLVLDLKNIINMDSSGVDGLMQLVRARHKNDVRLVVCGLMHQPLDIARRSGLLAQLEPTHLRPDLASGLACALRPD